MVPVTLNNLPCRFLMQLDLGAVTTGVHGNPIQPYLEKHPALKAKLDTTRTFWMQAQKNAMLTHVVLKLGPVSFGPRDVGTFKNFGDLLTAATLADVHPVHIGTVAPDLFRVKCWLLTIRTNGFASRIRYQRRLSTRLFNPLS